MRHRSRVSKRRAIQTGWSDEQKVAHDSLEAQQKVLRKLADTVSDAQEYYNVHGEQAVFLGFPILSLPPGKGSDAGLRSNSVLAPVFLMPLEVAVRRAAWRDVTFCGRRRERRIERAIWKSDGF